MLTLIAVTAARLHAALLLLCTMHFFHHCLCQHKYPRHLIKIEISLEEFISAFSSTFNRFWKFFLVEVFFAVRLKSWHHKHKVEKKLYYHLPLRIWKLQIYSPYLRNQMTKYSWEWHQANLPSAFLKTSMILHKRAVIPAFPNKILSKESDIFYWA